MKLWVTDDFSPVSIQPTYLQSKTISARTPIKSQENGQIPGEMDEDSLRKSEFKYTSYFQEHREVQMNAEALVLFA